MAVGKSAFVLWAAVLVASAALLSGCSGTADFSVLNPVQNNWVLIAFTAVLAMYFAVALLYMAGTGFGMPGLVAWCKSELFQITATAIMVFLLVLAIAGVDQLTRSLVDPDAITAYNVQPNDYALMKVAQGYMECQSDYIWKTTWTLIAASALPSWIYTSNIHVKPVKMGFSVQPAKAMQPIMDYVNVAGNLLAAGAWASRLIWHLLIFSEQTMFTIFLPLGVVLRSMPFTRSIGGALIAVAIALYVALPAATLINATVYKAYYGSICTESVWGERLIWLGGAFIDCVVQPLTGGGAGGPSYLEGVGGAALIAWAVGMTTFTAVGVGLLVGGLISFMRVWAQEVIFLLVILVFVGGVLQYMITFTFARELSKVLGADVDLSSLLKIL